MLVVGVENGNPHPSLAVTVFVPLVGQVDDRTLAQDLEEEACPHILHLVNLLGLLGL